MKLALFGGTFDPVHRGHLAIAREAAQKFDLSRVYFVPADLPPHKLNRELTDFYHRFAMLALATAGEERFVPSLLDSSTGQPNYSIHTVRRLKDSLRKSDKLYFLIGIDAFMEISTWYHPVELLAECEFIVASRPGFSLADVAASLPANLRPRPEVTKPFAKQPATGDLVLPGVSLHLLDNVNQNISATAVRQAVAAKRPIKKFVPESVEEYIKKEGLYGG